MECPPASESLWLAVEEQLRPCHGMSTSREEQFLGAVSQPCLLT